VAWCPVAVFPDDPVRGWLWPAAGFTAWHLVPLDARSSTTRRRYAVLVGAAVIGLGHGWIAQRTRSLALVTLVHALTDAYGIRPAKAIWLREGD
jgi:membrane protease YdiL (CAAX protease family)